MTNNLDSSFEGEKVLLIEKHRPQQMAKRDANAKYCRIFHVCLRKWVLLHKQWGV